MAGFHFGMSSGNFEDNIVSFGMLIHEAFRFEQYFQCFSRGASIPYPQCFAYASVSAVVILFGKFIAKSFYKTAFRAAPS